MMNFYYTEEPKSSGQPNAGLYDSQGRFDYNIFLLTIIQPCEVDSLIRSWAVSMDDLLRTCCDDNNAILPAGDINKEQRR